MVIIGYSDGRWVEAGFAGLNSWHEPPLDVAECTVGAEV